MESPCGNIGAVRREESERDREPRDGNDDEGISQG